MKEKNLRYKKIKEVCRNVQKSRGNINSTRHILPQAHQGQWRHSWYKYSLVYVRNGKNLVRYDNYMGHGHHKHIKDKRKEYEFKDEWQLISDFEEDLLKHGIKL